MKADDMKSKKCVTEKTNENIKDEKMLDQECDPRKCRDLDTERTSGKEVVSGPGDGRENDLERTMNELGTTDKISQLKATGKRLIATLTTLPHLPRKLKWRKEGVDPKITNLETQIIELNASNEQLQNFISDAKVQYEQVQQACDELEQCLHKRTNELDSTKETLRQTIDERDRVKKDLCNQINELTIRNQQIQDENTRGYCNSL